MTCDELRTLATEGAPLDEAARGHLAECPACGDEFAELRALTTAGSAAPDALRERVLAAFPVRRESRWAGAGRAAAMFLIGILGGFAGGYFAKPAKETVVVRPQIKEVEKPVSDDYVSNVGIAADGIYGPGRMGERHLVEVTFVKNSVQIQSIVVDPKMHEIEQYCPVARQLGSLATKRPDVVVYRKKEY